MYKKMKILLAIRANGVVEMSKMYSGIVSKEPNFC